MTLSELINDKQGTYVMYWYADDCLVCKKCEPEIIDEKTVKLFDTPLPNMADANLYCLIFEEIASEQVYIFNKGYIKNEDNTVIVSDDFTFKEDDKRLFYRYNYETTIMLMNSRYHLRVKMNNISYSGVNITTKAALTIGEEVMVYDPSETVPVYIPGTVVYHDGGDNYGIKINGNYDHINSILVPDLERHIAK